MPVSVTMPRHRQLRMSRRHQCVSQRDTKLAGEVVVAGAGLAQGHIAAARRRAALALAPARGDLHDAFQHLRHARCGETVVAVPALLLDGQKASGCHAGQMTARRLRRDSGDLRQLGGGKRAAVHQGLQHSGAGGITRECRDLCEHRIAGHESNPVAAHIF